MSRQGFWPLIGLTLLMALSFSRPAVAAPTVTPGAVIEAGRCEGLTGGRFTGLPGAATWVIKATYRPATAQARAACAVDAYVNPTINIGLLLPASDWNGKFVVRGCGGSCGSVWLDPACGKHLRDGYACLHTDMGHRSDQIDNNWVAGNLQGLVDFGYRATHVATVAGKAIVEAYYGTGPSKSYFFACSTGGRQAMIEAERFPTDFDGIVAVAPVNIGPFGVSNYVAPGEMNQDAQGRPLLTDLHVPMIYKAVMAQCDLKDGVADGLVDPRDCRFDPVSLVCKPGQTAGPRTCLTPEQADLVRRFYARGAFAGSELNWINNFTRQPGPPVEFAQSRGDPAVIETLNNAGNPDLRGFKAHGGKLILAHGTTDLIVLPGLTLDYYQMAERTMGGPETTRDFFRFFLIPGMDHCSGGDGAWGVNYLAALDRWADKGQAPDRLVGVHPKPGVELDYFGVDADRLTPDQIAFSRPYYPYPLKAYYAGKGDPNSAASFRPGLIPLGKIARLSPDDLPPADADALFKRLTTIATSTENVYVAIGLPPKNVTDRIAKGLRRVVYQTRLSPQDISQTLVRMQAAGPTPIARPALDSIQAEYPPT